MRDDRRVSTEATVLDRLLVRICDNIPVHDIVGNKCKAGAFIIGVREPTLIDVFLPAIGMLQRETSQTVFNNG